MLKALCMKNILENRLLSFFSTLVTSYFDNVLLTLKTHLEHEWITLKKNAHVLNSLSVNKLFLSIIKYSLANIDCLLILFWLLDFFFNCWKNYVKPLTIIKVSIKFKSSFIPKKYFLKKRVIHALLFRESGQ